MLINELISPIPFRICRIYTSSFEPNSNTNTIQTNIPLSPVDYGPQVWSLYTRIENVKEYKQHEEIAPGIFAARQYETERNGWGMPWGQKLGDYYYFYAPDLDDLIQFIQHNDLNIKLTDYDKQLYKIWSAVHKNL